jgi:hypothetical protein
MSVDDIDGAKPRVQRQFPHSNRTTNPLSPEYQLPSAPELPPVVPRFIRDGFTNDDIAGAHSKSFKSDRPPRDLMRVDDIPGTRPRRLIGDFRESRNLDVHDINNDGIFRTSRVTDPMNPVYTYDGGPCAAADFGRAFPARLRTDSTDLSLATADIEGAMHDSMTTRYKRFRRPKDAPEDEELAPAPLLMVPTMHRQTEELEIAEAVRKMRGERISRCENRHLRGHRGTGDLVQGALRQQREGKPRGRTPSKPTFSL